jgi:hypothetical protein
MLEGFAWKIADRPTREEIITNAGKDDKTEPDAGEEPVEKKPELGKLEDGKIDVRRAKDQIQKAGNQRLKQQ